MKKFGVMSILSYFLSSMAFGQNYVLVEQCIGSCGASENQKFALHYYYSTQFKRCYLLPDTEVYPEIPGLFISLEPTITKCGDKARIAISEICSDIGAKANVNNPVCKLFQINTPQ